jgi:hypothetical protein
MQSHGVKVRNPNTRKAEEKKQADKDKRKDDIKMNREGIWCEIADNSERQRISKSHG